MATIKVEEQSQKPLSIDDLFNQLDVDLREEKYDAYLALIGEVLNSQLIRYASMINEIKKRLGKNFDVHKYSKFGIVDVTDSDRVYTIKSEILVRFQSYKSLLESVISNLKSKIKFDNLSLEDRTRIEGIFKEQDVKTATYNYLKRELKDYDTNLNNYLHSMDELNEVAEEVRIHSCYQPSRLRWGARKVWNNKLNTLLETLKSRYEKANHDYRSLSDVTECLSFPTRVEDVQELNQIQKELRARDPESRIDIKKEGDKVYVILMESTKECPIDEEDEEGISPRDKYKMDKPSLKLYGEYEIEPGVREKVDIDLTEERKEAIFSNTVTCGKGQGLVEKLQVELRINLPQNEGFKLNSINIMGSYELPYLAETKTIEKHLITNAVQLI